MCGDEDAAGGLQWLCGGAGVGVGAGPVQCSGGLGSRSGPGPRGCPGAVRWGRGRGRGLGAGPVQCGGAGAGLALRAARRSRRSAAGAGTAGESGWTAPARTGFLSPWELALHFSSIEHRREHRREHRSPPAGASAQRPACPGTAALCSTSAGHRYWPLG